MGDNRELEKLFAEDRADRTAGAINQNPDLVAERDRRRRRRVTSLLDSGSVVTGADHFHAAMILQHGSALDAYRRAHELAKRAAELGDERGLWLAAAALDRWLVAQGRRQRFGTQYEARDGRWQLCSFDSSTTDDERASWNVPSLSEAVARGDRMTADRPPTPFQLPGPTDVVTMFVTREQWDAGETVSLNLEWSREPVHVALAHVEPYEALLCIDGRGRQWRPLWVRVRVDSEPSDL